MHIVTQQTTPQCFVPFDLCIEDLKATVIPFPWALSRAKISLVGRVHKFVDWVCPCSVIYTTLCLSFLIFTFFLALRDQILIYSLSRAYKMTSLALLQSYNFDYARHHELLQQCISIAVHRGDLTVLAFLSSLAAVPVQGEQHDCIEYHYMRVLGEDRGLTAVHLAAKNGHLEILNYLYARGYALHEPDDQGSTTLHYAAQEGHRDTVAFLLQKEGLAINRANHYSRSTALHYAARAGHLSVVKCLLDHRSIQVNQSTALQLTALHLAAKNGHRAVCRYLLSREGVNCNAKGFFGRTPLQEAAEQGHRLLVEEMMQCSSVSILEKDYFGQTVLHWAAYGGHLDLLQSILSRVEVQAFIPDDYGQTLCHGAAFRGHLNILKWAFESVDFDINSTDLTGRTVLHEAAHGGNQELVEYLLQRQGVCVNAVTCLGSTPLHLAGIGRNMSLVQSLIEREGVDLHIEDTAGHTISYWIIREDNQELLELFFQRLAPEYRQYELNKALTCAIALNKVYFCTYLRNKLREYEL